MPYTKEIEAQFGTGENMRRVATKVCFLAQNYAICVHLSVIYRSVQLFRVIPHLVLLHHAPIVLIVAFLFRIPHHSYTGGNKLPLVDKSFVYVIIDLAKNNLRQTEYKVSNLLGEDSWVRLKRGKGKSGIEFRVLRKVYFPPDPEKDKEKDGKQASGSEKSAPTPVTADE